MDARETSIMAHPRAQSASGKPFATWLATKTKLGIPECLVALEKMPKGGVSKNHPARRTADEQEEHEQYARPAATVPNARTPHRTAPRRPAIPQYSAEEQARQALIRADVEAANAQAEREFLAKHGVVDRRTPYEAQHDTALASLAIGALATRGETAFKMNPRGEAELETIGFGSSSATESDLYAQGAASASRLLGKMPSQSAREPSYASRTPAAGTPAACATRNDDAALYEAGANAAKNLLGMSHMRREIDGDLAANFAAQQRSQS